MKKIFTLLIAISFASLLSAQINEGGKPYSFTHTLTENFATKKLAPVSEEWKIRAEKNATKNGTIELVAKNIATNYSLNNSGTWETIKNGDKIWRLQITAQNAIGLNPTFKDFNLPKGAKLFIYSENYKQVLGAYTSFNNDESKIFATEIIFGNTMVLEYYEPRAQANKGSFTIEQVGSFFKNVNGFKGTNASGFGGSDDCQVNINCSPEGSNWQDEKKGVARILVKNGEGQGWCSGTLVNNTNLDCKPYFLTAYHCGNTSTAYHFNAWVFYFNYEFNGCSDSSEPSWDSMIGASVTAKANDLNASTTSSDFLLLELNQDVPQSYDVYYNGWSLQSSAPSSGVSIHHPSGDVKKISTYSSQPSTVGVSWAGDGYGITSGQTHWSVSWSSTTNGFGVTEGGSSGSPMFNNSGLVIGTLSGGGSSCNNQYSKDQYGKMNYHWESNSTVQNKQLKPWLDPTNSGVISFDGTYSPCSAATTNDASISEIINPKGDLCDDSYSPQIVLENNGALLLTSATIVYQINSNPPVSFNWVGSLIKGSSVIVDLTDGTSTETSNSFTVTVSNPNGLIDEDNSNNSMSSTFNTNVQKELPFIERFESNTFPSSNWYLINSDGEKTWESAAASGSYGTSGTAMYIDNWDYEAESQFDWFVSDAYDLSDSINDELYFDLAYTYYQQTNGSNVSYDSLGIAYSVDCGENFFWLWKDGGESLATLEGGLGEEFVPFDDEWESKVIPLDSNILGQPSVIFAFIAENGYGNNLYIDNIGVGKTLLALNDEVGVLNEMSLFPNPSTDLINLTVSLESKTIINFEIFNTIGQSLFSKNINTAIVNETINIANYAKGVYYVKVKALGEQKIIKFVKE